MRNALVIGAGVGGLACALALARRGVAVTVLERAQALREVGAGIQISPNGLVVLRALGLERALRARRAVEGQAVILRDHARGDEVARLDLGLLPSGQSYLFAHRADLIEVLARAVREAGVTLRLGVEVTDVVPGDLPSVLCADETSLRAELVVGADGIHSRTRRVLNGEDAAEFTGQVAWRATVRGVDHPAAAVVSMGPGRHLVSYPIRGGDLVNLVAVEERDAWAAEGWALPDDPANLRAGFAAFGGPARALIDAVEAPTLWGLHRHPVAPVWQRGGVALLGDAAHPTLPFLAQGANQALEDAWVLAACAGDLPRFEALRAARVPRVIRAAERNAWRYHLHPGPLRTVAHTALRLGSRVAPGRMLRGFDWLYAHDVTREV
ncbi:FAD-dependent monooxygenase [Sulfitobacter albidus]|uniref:FAD-dependent monooxygenase n=1 Tax=Sulfitobacter albidus TaxID=2829501 RepID=A0A975PN60_9RHOB|nr:FAD-dependent monooxygenase [Sulfitobacter albidus]QUJ77522.1 FAD-dependent monooxygenase [Sulfitobacter albidus]